MANTEYKSAAIPLSGYLYQNLVGLELLCNWLDDPALYEWVWFESDEENTPQGLDDFVAERSDGLRVMYQVKFTVNPFDEDNFLSWEWLLNKKPKGRSLLQKWFKAFESVGASRVSEAALITNRLPDREIHSCFSVGLRRIDPSKIAPAVFQRIVEQFGSKEDLERFFSLFEFQHSRQGYLSLERTLLDRLVPRHTNHHGWLCLFREAVDWAVRKAFPPPDGRVSLNHIRGVISSHRPAPLPQSFRVPDNYIPPDDSYAEAFVANATQGKRNVTVLWGSPGQGKSTFLSHVCKEFERLEIPCIRHHYFLELSDNSDRFSLSRVADSLMDQMEGRHVGLVKGLSNQPEHLREWIEACANGYALQGKRFIVVVDGLDHVWRENDGNKRPLDSLFQSLLPVPTNVTLLLGTQRVAEHQLPAQFRRFVDSQDWTELPRMSLKAIRRWLEVQLEANRFELSSMPRPGEDTLASVAEAFERLSGGHPLILTYSFETLAREARVLTKDVVDEFPMRPEGDVKKYYTSLWKRITSPARDALHLIADAGYVWPPLGLESCLKIEVGELSKEIGHLFHLTDVGQVPFHGSLLVHIKETSEYEDSVKRLLPQVVTWLEVSAPAFHRWGWLWIYKARLGDSRDVVSLPSRRWALESLENGYPRDQLDEILTVAERIAFTGGDFARAVRIRWLKIRILNGTDLQLEDYGRVRRCALTPGPDEYPRKLLAAGVRTATVDQLHLLAVQYLRSGRVPEAAECQENIRRRINDRLSAHAYQDQELKEDLKQLLELMAATGKYEAKNIVESIQQFNTMAPELFVYFLSKLSRKKDLKLFFEIGACPMGRDMRERFEVETIRLAGQCVARVHEWPEFNRFRRHPLSSCWTLLYSPEKYRPTVFKLEVSAVDTREFGSGKVQAEHFLHKLFFSTLANCIQARGASVIGESIELKNRKWLPIAVERIVAMANTTGAVLARGDAPGFSILYRLADSVVPPAEYELFTEYVAFRKALLTSSWDLFLLTAVRTGMTEVTEAEWMRASSSKHFLMSEWLERSVQFDQSLISREAIKESINSQLEETAASVSSFNDRTLKYLELCELATSQDLEGPAREALKHVLRCVIGYGWRKDGTLSFVVQAIEAIGMVDADFGRDAVRRIGGIVLRIEDMTEDDATRESDLAELLVRLAPTVFADYYAYWIANSEWYTADLVFAKFLELCPLDSPEARLCMAAISDSYSVQVLRAKAKEGDENAKRFIAENSLRFGRSDGELGRKRDRSSPTDESFSANIQSFGPNELRKLVEALKSEKAIVGERKAMREWFDHWNGKGRDIEILKSIDEYLVEDDFPWGVAELLDDAFELSLRLEGRAAAYRFLVAAQRFGHGWDAHYSKEAALRRFNVFAKNYRTKWKEFIYDSGRSAFKFASETLHIPHHRLVQFLIAVDELPLAKGVASEMIASVVEEFEDQPINSPSWLKAI